MREEWEDVTDDCTVEFSSVKGWQIFHDGHDVGWATGYQLTLRHETFDGNAAICVEKKKS